MTETRQGCFYFDPADPIYKEHFPGNPVVPGSVIIHAFVKALENETLCPSSISLENFRFKQFVSPGKYRFSIIPEPGAVRCTLFENDKAVVTGVIRT